MLVKKIINLLHTTKIQFTSFLYILVESGQRVRKKSQPFNTDFNACGA